MRSLGWWLVLLLFAGSALFLTVAWRTGVELESKEMRGYAQTLSNPLLHKYRPDIVADGAAFIRGKKEAESLLIVLGLGAGALGLVSTVIMAATSPRRGSRGGHDCAACGVAIVSGTLCDNCRA